MISFLTINILLFLSIMLLSLLLIYVCKEGVLGLRLKKFCMTNSLIELVLLLFIFVGFIMLITEFLLLVINYFFIDLKLEYLTVIGNPDPNIQDPVRYWPAGTPQTWGILASALAAYRLTPGTPRMKAMVALGSLTITIPGNVYFHAIENPNGFHRLMYSWFTYKNTGEWPANIPSNMTDTDLNTIEVSVNQAAAVTENQINNINNFSVIPTENRSIISDLNPESIFNYLLSLFRPVSVEGYLDDLIGQQLFIQFLLLIVVIGLILILSVYIMINIMVNNKELITKRFNNRFVLLFIKYQLFLSKISLFILPLFLMVGLVELFVGLYYIVTHPLPYDKLPVDNLHIYIKK